MQYLQNVDIQSQICVLGESRRHRDVTALASWAPFLVPLLSLEEEKLEPHLGWQVGTKVLNSPLL